ncbi:hypothetical protein [Brumicola nitratireducens]|uniref:hypothetical protein n=1 Tax=Brumicola nitratireducens TaxID=300231 RepID=UPI00059ED06B|nr:hypothetical protein [Glaciecola nitratireducens]
MSAFFLFKKKCYREQQARPFHHTNALFAILGRSLMASLPLDGLCGEKASPAAPDNTYHTNMLFAIPGRSLMASLPLDGLCRQRLRLLLPVTLITRVRVYSD